MIQTLTRMFALIAFIAYLFVGVIAVRILAPEITTFTINVPSHNWNDISNFEEVTDVGLVAPEIKFAEFNVQETKIAKKTVAKAQRVKSKPIQVEIKEDILELAAEQLVAVHESELPFHDPIKVEPVKFEIELQTNLLASYKEFEFRETLVADSLNENMQDEVKTVQAQSVDAEPDFFEYAESTKDAKDAKEENVIASIDNNEAVVSEVSPVHEQSGTEVVIMDDLVANDYPSEVVNTQPKPKSLPQTTVQSQVTSQAILGSMPSGSTQKNNYGISFDYSKAKKSIAKNKRTLAAVGPKVSGKGSHGANENAKGIVPDATDPEPEPSPVGYPSDLKINAYGVDLKNIEDINGFEIKFQDDQAESFADYGTGEVRVQDMLAQPKMTRSLVLLKRGFIPTNADIILEEGDRNISLPMIEESKFNSLMEKYEGKYPVGSVLVELDDVTELAQLDVAFGEVITLDGDFKETSKDNFRYQLFLGVKAGNALLSYKQTNAEPVSKIIHVHEHEVTFDANHMEDVLDEKIRLYEESLLSKEPSSLIISTESVRVFMKSPAARKVNNFTYKMNFGTHHLGGRRYIELNHQREPIFIGLRENNHLHVPSEKLMRHVLSNFEGSELGNRCLIQINLNKKALDAKFGSESVSSSLMFQAQMLDNDGKFYDSLSEKTEKILVVGESHASGTDSQDAKINAKITFEDGTSQYFSSYCSPNTYLVEQL